MDGKTIWGTQHYLAPDQNKVHQVTLYEVQTGVILKEQVVQEKEGEQRRATELLIPQWVKGRIMTADALHTHAKVCAAMVASRGDYLLFAKGNQPTLLQDLQHFFADPRGLLLLAGGGDVQQRAWTTRKTDQYRVQRLSGA